MTATPPRPICQAPQRLHALDHLRAAMMWLGIVLHVCVVYMASPSPLPWHDDQSTPLADLLVAGIHAFRMPLFFILAGFFVALLVQQRGLAGMAWHRLRRLGLPFAVFWPPLLAATALLGLLFLHRMAYGTWVAYSVPKIADPGSHFGSPLYEFPFTDTKVYIGFTALLLNVVVVVVGTAVLRALKVPGGVDQTSPEDYHADAGDEGVEEELDPYAPAHG